MTRLTRRLDALAHRGGCRLCDTGAMQFTICTDGERLAPGAKAAEYKRCPACGRQMLVWFTIAIDRIERESDAGGETCD